MAETLSDYALCTLEEAKSYLKRTGSTADDDVMTRGINYVTGQIEDYCRRRLKERTYDGAATAGHAPKIIMNGTGGNFFLPDYPISNLVSVEVLLGDGISYRSLNVIGAQVTSRGLVSLPFDVAPAGFRNLRIICTAGIPAFNSGTIPTAGAQVEEWKTLNGAALRLLQVSFFDRAMGVGRGTGFGVGSENVSFNDVAIPPDVKQALSPFQRWM